MLTPDNFKVLPRREPSSETNRSQDNEESRPKPLPNQSKDFKEVLDDKSEKPHLVDENGLKKEKIKPGTEKKSEKKGMSLFDLARSEKNQGEFAKNVDDALSQSNSELQQQLLSEEEQLKLEKKKNALDELQSKKEKLNSQFTQHSPDISYLDPLAAGALAKDSLVASIATKLEQTQPVASPIHEIVTELIDKLTRVEMKGQTDTIVVINKEGAFKDAIIVISEFDTANGQLNLAFENLKNDAKLLLDNPANRTALMESLATKGYTVTQMVTTTIVEHEVPTLKTETSQPNPDQEKEEPDQQKQNKKSK